jgi:subtilase family serine protease
VTAVGATNLASPTGNEAETSTEWCGLRSSAISSISPAGTYTYDSGFSTPFELACVTGGSEVAVNTNFRSGGGFSRFYPQPSWQASAVNSYLRSSVTFPSSSYYNASNRAIPDVSMYGAGFPLIIGGEITVVGGTSLSSPLFAVVVSMLNEVSLNAGGATLGFLNPLLCQPSHCTHS